MALPGWPLSPQLAVQQGALLRSAVWAALLPPRGRVQPSRTFTGGGDSAKRIKKSHELPMRQLLDVSVAKHKLILIFQSYLR